MQEITSTTPSSPTPKLIVTADFMSPWWHSAPTFWPQATVPAYGYTVKWLPGQQAVLTIANAGTNTKH